MMQSFNIGEFIMTATVNICPTCKKNNELETMVCSNCGTVLEKRLSDLETGPKTTNMVSIPKAIMGWSIEDTAAPEKGIAHYLEGNFTPSHIDEKAEFIIGRNSGKTSEIVEGLFDLSSLGGYGQGISRQHAIIRRMEHGYELADLGSANGTWLNSERLASHKPYPLPSGSHLRLGSMRLYVLYRTPAKTK
jgi:hypothetical protein